MVIHRGVTGKSEGATIHRMNCPLTIFKMRHIAATSTAIRGSRIAVVVVVGVAVVIAVQDIDGITTITITAATVRSTMWNIRHRATTTITLKDTIIRVDVAGIEEVRTNRTASPTITAANTGAVCIVAVRIMAVQVVATEGPEAIAGMWAIGAMLAALTGVSTTDTLRLRLE